MPIAIGAALGAINGLLVAYGRVSPLIATLGTMSLYRGAHLHLRPRPGGHLQQPAALDDRDRSTCGSPASLRSSSLAAAIVCAPGDVPPLLPDRPADLRGRLEPRRERFLRPAHRAHRPLRLRHHRGPLRPRGLPLRGAGRHGDRGPGLGLGADLAGGGGDRRRERDRRIRHGRSGAALGAVVLATIDNGLVLLRVPEFWRMFIQGTAIVGAATVDVVIGLQLRGSLQARRRTGGAMR